MDGFRQWGQRRGRGDNFTVETDNPCQCGDLIKRSDSTWGPHLHVWLTLTPPHPVSAVHQAREKREREMVYESSKLVRRRGAKQLVTGSGGCSCSSSSLRSDAKLYFDFSNDVLRTHLMFKKKTLAALTCRQLDLLASLKTIHSFIRRTEAQIWRRFSDKRWNFFKPTRQSFAYIDTQHLFISYLCCQEVHKKHIWQVHKPDKSYTQVGRCLILYFGSEVWEVAEHQECQILQSAILHQLSIIQHVTNKQTLYYQCCQGWR